MVACIVYTSSWFVCFVRHIQFRFVSSIALAASVRLLVGCLVSVVDYCGWLVDWCDWLDMVGWFVLLVCTVCWCCLSVRLVWFYVWLISWSVGWLVGWLVGCSCLLGTHGTFDWLSSIIFLVIFK